MDVIFLLLLQWQVVSIFHNEKITTASILGLTVANNRLFKNESTTIIDCSLPSYEIDERVAVI